MCSCIADAELSLTCTAVTKTNADKLVMDAIKLAAAFNATSVGTVPLLGLLSSTCMI